MKRLLVGLDGSARAPSVLATATTLARAIGGHLTAIRSVGLPPDVPQDLFKTTDQPLLDLLCEEARTYLEKATTDVSKELLESTRFEVVVGAPWYAICAAARRLETDLIVIGSHGYGGLDRLLGTTAAKIVNHAPCSVLVVRDHETEGAAGGRKT
ncbi:MAG: universal stress protein [Polyangiaceae bacterium]|jgi:nucleotide-binding universal stress UspA family protein